MTFTFSSDVWTALHASEESWTEYDDSPLQRPLLLQHQKAWWVAAGFMHTHTVVMSLRATWFTKMIATLWNTSFLV